MILWKSQGMFPYIYKSPWTDKHLLKRLSWLCMMWTRYYCQTINKPWHRMSITYSNSVHNFKCIHNHLRHLYFSPGEQSLTRACAVINGISGFRPLQLLLMFSFHGWKPFADGYNFVRGHWCVDWAHAKTSYYLKASFSLSARVQKRGTKPFRPWQLPHNLGPIGLVPFINGVEPLHFLFAIFVELQTTKRWVIAGGNYIFALVFKVK